MFHPYRHVILDKTYEMYTKIKIMIQKQRLWNIKVFFDIISQKSVEATNPLPNAGDAVMTSMTLLGQWCQFPNIGITEIA